MIKAILLFILAVFFPAVASSQDNLDVRLFVEIPPGADLPDAILAKMGEILGRPTSTSESKIVQLRPSFITDSMLRLSVHGLATIDPRNVTISLTSGRLIAIAGLSYERVTPSSTSWIGRVVSDSNSDGNQAGTVAIAIEGDSISGTVNLPDAIYQLNPINDDFLAITKVDQSKARPDEPPDEQKYDRRSEHVDNNPTLIAIIFWYTKDAKAIAEQQSRSIGQFITQLVAEANASFINSDIPIRYTVAGSVAVDYEEENDWIIDRDRFFTTGDGFMDGTVSDRDSMKADLGVFLLSSRGYCGEVMAIHSAAETAFAVVDVDPGCTLKYTFTHETGHLFGAEHNPNNASSPPYRPYGHGYINGDLWRTMMSYQHGCSPCNRILYWSSPSILYPTTTGVPTGTPEQYDNARVLREARELVSMFR